jgi:hypothetical protein
VESTLEQRRLAIVAALRAVMSEPLPTPTAPAAVDEPLFVEPAAAATDLVVDAAPPAVIDLRSDPVLDEAGADFEIWDDEADEPDDETHSVPPVESLGSMSKAASLALFGHA